MKCTGQVGFENGGLLKQLQFRDLQRGYTIIGRETIPRKLLIPSREDSDASQTSIILNFMQRSYTRTTASSVDLSHFGWRAWAIIIFPISELVATMSEYFQWPWRLMIWMKCREAGLADRTLTSNHGAHDILDVVDCLQGTQAELGVNFSCANNPEILLSYNVTRYRLVLANWQIC